MSIVVSMRHIMDTCYTMAVWWTHCTRVESTSISFLPIHGWDRTKLFDLLRTHRHTKHKYWPDILSHLIHAIFVVVWRPSCSLRGHTSAPVCGVNCKNDSQTHTHAHRTQRAAQWHVFSIQPRINLATLAIFERPCLSDQTFYQISIVESDYEFIILTFSEYWLVWVCFKCVED